MPTYLCKYNLQSTALEKKKHPTIQPTVPQFFHDEATGRLNNVGFFGFGEFEGKVLM